MRLGDRRYFAQEHYEAQRGVAPAHLAELVVYCLELVSQLSHHGLEYRFKGGNSLLVLLEDPHRFSIDVDIATAVTKDELSAVVARVVAGADAFSRHEVRLPKTKPWLPLASFKLFFDSVYQPAEDAYVMLDAVFEPAPYPGERRPVRCGTLYASEATVEVPTVAGLVGDKLLTLGPATLGIPLGKGKEAQRLKHVFDVALLARQDPDLDLVGRSVAACMAQENRIQATRFDLDAVVEDTIRFVQAPLEAATRPDPESVREDPYLYEIAVGFEAFRQHLFRIEYSWQLLQDDCRRILALLEALLAAPGH